MKTISHAFVICLVILLTSCSSKTYIPLAEKREIPDNEESCKKVSGSWTRLGVSSSYTCDLKSNDVNKICTDNTQCEGSCLLRSWNETTHEPIGSCSEYLINYGCYSYLENNNVRSLCAS